MTHSQAKSLKDKQFLFPNLNLKLILLPPAHNFFLPVQTPVFLHQQRDQWTETEKQTSI